MSSSSKNAAKKRKLHELNEMRRRLPHMTATALSAVLLDVKKHGMPELMSRHQLAAATEEIVNYETPYGKMILDISFVKSEGGDALVVPVANPLAYMWKAFNQGGNFSSFFEELLRGPSGTYDNPLKLIVYADEVTPGRELALVTTRKIWCIYYGFAEFRKFFHNEESWFPLLAMRTDLVAQVSAGISQVMAGCLKLFFGDAGADAEVAGFRVTTPGGTSYRVHIKVEMFLQDGGAHKAMYHMTGDAGSKMCCLCTNLFSQRSDIVGEDGSNLLTCSILHESDLHFATDSNIFDAVDRLADWKKTLKSGQFKLREQVLGFRHKEHGLLQDITLRDIVRPASNFCHDWMHTLASSGVVQTVIYLLLSALVAELPDVYARLHTYVKEWSWPQRLHRKGNWNLFLPKRREANNKAKAFKCTASEALCLLPILAYWVAMLPMAAGVCVNECKAFLALSDIADMLSGATKDGCQALVEPLRGAIRFFLEQCIIANWTQWMHPKFHWLVHLPRHLRKFGFLPSCWTHERKHKVARRLGGDIHNSSVYEKSTLKELLCYNLFALKSEKLFIDTARLVLVRNAAQTFKRWLRKALPNKDVSDCKTSTCVKLPGGGSCNRGDVVLFKTGESSMTAGRALVLFEINSSIKAVVEAWEPQKLDMQNGVALWTSSDPCTTIIECTDLLASAINCEVEPGTMRTLLPWDCRRLGIANALG